MGARGPLPQPDNVRALRGNPGHRKPPVRPKAVVAVPDPPSWLAPEAKAEWKRVTPELKRMGLVAQIDRGLLSTYSSAWARFVACEKEIQKADGMAVKGENGHLKKHPLWQVYRDSAALVASLGDKLGLSPAARGRMTVPEREEGEGDGILD